MGSAYRASGRTSRSCCGVARSGSGRHVRSPVSPNLGSGAVRHRLPRLETDSVASPLALSIRALKFRYPGAAAGAFIVNIPSLDLARGEQMLLTGGSGRGKSTLLQLISGLLD